MFVVAILNLFEKQAQVFGTDSDTGCVHTLMTEGWSQEESKASICELGQRMNLREKERRGEGEDPRA